MKQKKKLLGAMLACVMALCLSFSAFAADFTASTWDELQAAFGSEDTTVTVTLTADIKCLDKLEALEGQTVTINGVDYTLTNVYLGGDGNVNINADINGDGNDAISTVDGVTVNVTGDISTDSSGYDGVYAVGDSTVTVTGNITASDNGVDAEDASTVTVTGNIDAGDDGVKANNNATVTVNGNVTGGSGNPDSVDMSDPSGYSDGSDGVYAEDSATVTVTGNVTGGDAYGSFGYAGDGVNANDTATVTVGGNVTGGNVIADSSVETSDTSLGGTGVSMDSTATVTVDGNVTGGNTSGYNGEGGDGVEISLVLKTPSTDIMAVDGADTETPLEGGALTVGGTVTNGIATATDGTNGNGIYFGFEDDGLSMLNNDPIPAPGAGPTIEEVTALLDQYAIPDVTVHSVVVTGESGALYASAFANEDGDPVAAALGADTNYSVRIASLTGGAVTTDKTAYQAGETVVITPTPATGYTLGSVLVNGTVIEAVNGVYSIVMPEGGGISLAATFTAVSNPSTPSTGSDTTSTGNSPKTGDVSPVLLMAGLLSAGVVCFGGILLMRKKEN